MAIAATLRYDVVVMVASLGGITAVRDVLEALPADFPVPILLVQHRSSAHPSRLVAILQRSTRLKVVSAEPGATPLPGIVYVAPPDHHLVVTARGTLALADGTRVRGLLSAGDPLFASAARAFGAGVIAVVLTGMDSNGARGVADVKSAGGFVIAQDRETSEAFAMPQAAIATGCVDAVLPIQAIAGELIRLTEAGVQEKPA